LFCRKWILTEETEGLGDEVIGHVDKLISIALKPNFLEEIFSSSPEFVKYIDALKFAAEKVSYQIHR
jgi:hypothetical protein